MKQFVMMYDNTITVLRQAMMFASRSLVPAFSPKALAHSLHINVPHQPCLVLTLVYSTSIP